MALTALTEATVRRVFQGLEQGVGAAFFDHVADDVNWTVMGTHPLAGYYRGRDAYLAATFARLAKVLPGDTRLLVEHVIVAGDEAVVEMRADAVARHGRRFDDRGCWVTRFSEGRIVRVRAYLASALVARLLAENPTD